MRPDADGRSEELPRLSMSERSEAVARLLSSLDGDAESGVEAAWDAELQRRVEDLTSGRVSSVPLADARWRIVSDA